MFFLSAILCALAISLALNVYLVVKLNRMKRIFRRYMSTFRWRDSILNETVDRVVGIVKELLETAATSTFTPDLFIKRLTRTLFLNPDNPQSVVYNIDVIADLRFYGVITYLRENNWKLTQDDLVFCSLICFDFPQPTISLLYGHTNDQSYYNRRGRIRKKLNISKDGEHIRTYLKRLIEMRSPEKV